MGEAREYCIDRALPKFFGNLIKPPIIWAPDVRGRFVRTWLNDNNLYNIELEGGAIIRNVDFDENMHEEAQNMQSKLAGNLTIFCNVTQDSQVIPFEKFLNPIQLTTLKSRVESAEAQRDAFREKIQERPGSAYADMRMTKNAAMWGEMAFNLSGKHLAAKGKGWDKRQMSPTEQEVISQFGEPESNTPSP